MDKERRDQIIRIGGLSAFAFLAIVVITGFKNLKNNKPVKEGQIGHYDELVTDFDIKVASLERTFESSPIEINWEQLEELEKKKISRKALLPESPISVAEKMAPAIEPPASLGDRLQAIQLTGIAWSTEAPLAFVGNRVLRTRDRLEGFTITVIHQDGIELMDDRGDVARLNLYETLHQ